MVTWLISSWPGREEEEMSCSPPLAPYLRLLRALTPTMHTRTVALESGIRRNKEKIKEGGRI